VRFVEHGADIPDELIRAVTDGSATFLCGAGISFRVNLPSFKKLTERVYARLGETPTDPKTAAACRFHTLEKTAAACGFEVPEKTAA